MTRACLIIIPLVFCGASASGQLSFSDRTADAQVEAYQIPFGVYLFLSSIISIATLVSSHAVQDVAR